MPSNVAKGILVSVIASTAIRKGRELDEIRITTLLRGCTEQEARDFADGHALKVKGHEKMNFTTRIAGTPVSRWSSQYVWIPLNAGKVVGEVTWRGYVSTDPGREAKVDGEGVDLAKMFNEWAGEEEDDD